MERICVFCASHNGSDPRYLKLAKELGQALVRKKITVIYGGGSFGLMGALCRSVIEHHGKIIGVIPNSLVEKESPPDNLTELHMVDSMHERKLLMMDLSDAFLCLPGGLGTLDEIFEVLLWAQLGMHTKPCGLLDIKNYYRPLSKIINRGIADEFIDKETERFLIIHKKIEDLIQLLLDWKAPKTQKWLNRKSA